MRPLAHSPQVRSFLRGSISNPAQGGAAGQPQLRRPGQLSPSALAAASRAAAAAVGYGEQRGGGEAGGSCGVQPRGGRPPRPPLAPQPGPRERPRWSHLAPSAQEAAAGSPPRGAAPAAGQQPVLRGSIDLGAILDSCEPSPQASSESLGGGTWQQAPWDKEEEEEGQHQAGPLYTTSSFGLSAAAAEATAAEAGGAGGDGWGSCSGELPQADLELLRISSRPASRMSNSMEEAQRGSVSQVRRRRATGPVRWAGCCMGRRAGRQGYMGWLLAPVL